MRPDKRKDDLIERLLRGLSQVGGSDERVQAFRAVLRAAVYEVSPFEPVAMLLWCPHCGERHIDKDSWALRPHHTHACQHCGMVWRPAIEDTVGVQFLPGFKDKE